MKIALIGYGKMGRAIEQQAIARNHEVVLKINTANLHEFTREKLAAADVAIEFTGPHTAFENVAQCLRWGLPVVTGSTGWNQQLEAATALCKSQNGAFLHASNFSVGVNIFFEVNKLLAQLMAHRSEYDVTLKEIHHTQKKDAPSGTAVTLAEQVLQHLQRKKAWVNNNSSDPGTLSIISERTDPAPGTHFVTYNSPVDSIEIIHTAHNREGFAQGAVLAAEFISDKKGIFSMKDVLDF